MKKTISICFFAGGLVIAVAALGLILRFGAIRQKNEPLPEETLVAEFESEETIMSTESMAIREPYEYVLVLKDGFLVVYLKDKKTVLFETNIREEDLNENILKRLEAGVYLTDDKELYDFLESYSS